jgi:hypothetical protein
MPVQPNSTPPWTAITAALAASAGTAAAVRR